MKSLIDSGNFDSVVVYQDHVYAARYVDYDEPRDVRVYKHSGGWTKVHSFKVISGFITLSVQNNQVKCCSRDEHKIAVYSLTGQLLQTHGSYGSGDAGQFKYPYTCGDDDDGSMLIADYNNDRLQVMSKQGEFSVLQLQPPVSRPRGAVLFNNNLYVTSQDKQTVCKYSS